MSNRITILRNVYKKLDNMTLSFGMPVYSNEIDDAEIERYLGITLDDTMRELRLSSIDDIMEMSSIEYHIENRCLYHKLRLLRNSASVFFKFSTSVDGKTVDKSMIPKMLNEMIKEYDNEWRDWLSNGADGLYGTVTGIWGRSPQDGTSWHREMNE